MTFRRSYTVEKVGSKEKVFWEALEKEVKREATEEVRADKEEIRVYESNPLFSVRLIMMKERVGKDLEINVRTDSKKETPYAIVFVIIGLYMILGLYYKNYYQIISGVVGCIIYWFLLDYFIKTKEKEILRNSRGYMEYAARKARVEFD